MLPAPPRSRRGADRPPPAVPRRSHIRSDRRSYSACKARASPVPSSVRSSGVAGKLAQAVGVAVGKAERDLDPFPAFGGDLVGCRLQLLGDQPVEQRDILQPAAIVGLEQIAQHDAAGRLIGVDADEQRRACRRRAPRFRSACGGSATAPSASRAGSPPRPVPGGHGPARR